MKLRREAKFVAWIVAALVSAIAAFVVGGALKPEEAPHYVFDVSAPAYQADLGAIAARSPGGFTGFGELAGGDDRTVIGGRVVELTSSQLIIETQQGAQTTLRLGVNPKLTRLAAGSRQLLKPGATVIVRRGEQQNEAAAVLVLSAP